MVGSLASTRFQEAQIVACMLVATGNMPSEGTQWIEPPRHSSNRNEGSSNVLMRTRHCPLWTDNLWRRHLRLLKCVRDNRNHWSTQPEYAPTGANAVRTSVQVVSTNSFWLFICTPGSWLTGSSECSRQSCFNGFCGSEGPLLFEHLEILLCGCARRFGLTGSNQAQR